MVLFLQLHHLSNKIQSLYTNLYVVPNLYVVNFVKQKGEILKNIYLTLFFKMVIFGLFQHFKEYLSSSFLQNGHFFI